MMQKLQESNRPRDPTPVRRSPTRMITRSLLMASSLAPFDFPKPRRARMRSIVVNSGREVTMYRVAGRIQVRHYD